MEQSEEALYAHMRENFQVMSQCIEPGCQKDLKSTSGLTGGSAFKMRRWAESGRSLTGSLMAGALYRALAVSELNAAMGRIVAAPQREAAASCPPPSSPWSRAGLHGARLRDGHVHCLRHRHGHRQQRLPCRSGGGMPGGVRIRSRHGSRSHPQSLPGDPLSRSPTPSPSP